MTNLLFSIELANALLQLKAGTGDAPHLARWRQPALWGNVIAALLRIVILIIASL